jgi:hypothetical protein
MALSGRGITPIKGRAERRERAAKKREPVFAQRAL